MDPLMEEYPTGNFKTETIQDDKFMDIKEEVPDEPAAATHFEECFVSSLPECYPTDAEDSFGPKAAEQCRTFGADHDAACKSEHVDNDGDYLCHESEGYASPYPEGDISHQDVSVLKSLLVQAKAARGFELAIDDGGLAAADCKTEDLVECQLSWDHGDMLPTQSSDGYQPAEWMADDDGDSQMMAPSPAETCPIEDADCEGGGPDDLIVSGSTPPSDFNEILTPEMSLERSNGSTAKDPRRLVRVSGANFEEAVAIMTGDNEIWVVENEEQIRALSLPPSTLRRPLKRFRLKGRFAKKIRDSGCVVAQSSTDFSDEVFVKPADDESGVVKFEEITSLSSVMCGASAVNDLFGTKEASLFEQSSSEKQSSNSDGERTEVQSEKITTVPPKAKTLKPLLRDCILCGLLSKSFQYSNDKPSLLNHSNIKVNQKFEEFCSCIADRPKTNRRKQMIMCRNIFKKPLVTCMSIYEKYDDKKKKMIELIAKNKVSNSSLFEAKKIATPRSKAMADDKDDKFGNQDPSLMNQLSSTDNVKWVFEEDCLSKKEPSKAKKPLIMCRPNAKNDKFDNQESSLKHQLTSTDEVEKVVEGDCVPTKEPPKTNRRKQSIVCKSDAIVEPETTLTDSEEEDYYETEYVSYTRSELAIHKRMRYRRRAFQCLECDITFCTEFGLECHVCGQDQVSFVCKRCLLGFPSEWTVVAHECAGDERMQTQTRAACKICGVNLTRRLLMRHMTESHADVLARWNVGDNGEDVADDSDVEEVR